MTWVAGSVLTAAQMNTYVRDNLNYLKSETDLFDAHAAAGSAVHGLGANIYVLGYKGSTKWTATGTASITTAVNTGMNFDAPGNVACLYGVTFSAIPCVITEANQTTNLDAYAITQAHSLTTTGFTLRAYRDGVAGKGGSPPVYCVWCALGA